MSAAQPDHPDRPRQPDTALAPRDYAELLARYHGMVLAMADRMGIPYADREDAAAEVELRFWRADGLSWHDPDLLHAPPPGGWRDGAPPLPRPARFSTLMRRFTYLHMLQERDRHLNRLRRLTPTDLTPEPDDTHKPGDTQPPDPLATSTTRDTARHATDRARELAAPHPLLAELLEDRLRAAIADLPTTRAATARRLGIGPATVASRERALHELLTPLREELSSAD